MADLSAAKSGIKDSAVKGTNTKQAHGWDRYKRYLLSIRISEDTYLDSFSCGQKHQSLAPLLKPSEKVDLGLEALQIQNQNMSEPPWIAWHRSLDWQIKRIHNWTQTKKLHSCYNDSFMDTKT